LNDCIIPPKPELFKGWIKINTNAKLLKDTSLNVLDFWLKQNEVIGVFWCCLQLIEIGYAFDFYSLI
jgi:hypothetical protein